MPRLDSGNVGWGNDKRGGARVYEYIGNNWSQLGDDIEGEAARDRAGAQKSISLSDDGLTLAVGFPLNDDSGTNYGKVRVYEYQSGSWSQIGSDILVVMPTMIISVLPWSFHQMEKLL